VSEHPELTYLGLNAADTPAGARDFVSEFGWEWPSISDPRRELAKTLGADYQPEVIVIDAQGRIVASLEGAGDDEAWEALAAKLP
jgi:hypothetical protein